MTQDRQDLQKTGNEQEKSAMNTREFEPRIIAFCCQY